MKKIIKTFKIFKWKVELRSWKPAYTYSTSKNLLNILAYHKPILDFIFQRQTQCADIWHTLKLQVQK